MTLFIMSTIQSKWQRSYLDKKYKTEDVGTKKFIVGRFLKYKIVDNKTIISQVKEFQFILHEIEAEGMNLPETFQEGQSRHAPSFSQLQVTERSQ